MRPVRTIIAVIFAAAVAVTGCSTHTTADQPSAAPAPPVTAAPAPPVTAAPAPPTTEVSARQPAPKRPAPAPQPPRHRNGPIVDYVPAPVLADGRYDSYIRRVEVPYEGGGSRLVVDLVQVFDGQAARDAAIADGMARDKAQYLGVYVRNQNPRLRTLPLASDVRLDLRGGDCEAPLNHQLTKLMADVRAMSGPVHTYYFSLTVHAGAVQQVQEFLAINAC
jgi:hypothetical protein